MTTAVKEHGMLFSGEMVRALLDGRKSQTRRPMKPQPYRDAGFTTWMYSAHHGCGCDNPPCECWLRESPIKVGDRVWVRETWGDRADYAAIGRYRKGDRYYYLADGRKSGWKYRPSIHMPRWASRITLEVTSVRVERIQEVSKHDIACEGWPGSGDTDEKRIEERSMALAGLDCDDAAIEWFADLWDAIYDKGAWERNDWVWVYQFRVVTGEFVYEKDGR